MRVSVSCVIANRCHLPKMMLISQRKGGTEIISELNLRPIYATLCTSTVSIHEKSVHSIGKYYEQFVLSLPGKCKINLNV